MSKSVLRAAMIAVFSMGCLMVAQAAQAQAPVPPPYPPPPAAQGLPGQDINVQFLGEMLRSATTFHDVVRSMELDKRFGSQYQQAADPYDPNRQRRELARTAEIMGAGAGVGIAIGGMSHSEKGLLIGALVGSAGGLVIDQIMRHKQATQQQAVSGPQGPPPHELRQRDPRDRYDSDRDNSYPEQRR